MDKKIIDIEALKYYNKKISESKQDKLVSGENIKTINGDSILGDGNLNIETIKIDYNQLKSLRDNFQLIPGASYRITDYITTTIQKNTTSAGHQFDIIVTALDESTLSEEAKAIQHDGDTYFTNSNLNKWQLWYCLDNDDTRFGWASDVITQVTGKIYKHDSSQCTIQSDLVNENSFITPFNFESCVWVDGNGDGAAYDDDSNHDSNELIYEWGYFTDENDNTQLCLYKSDAEMYEEEGQPDYGDKYLYRGIITVDGTDYDYWQKWDEEYEGINLTESGDHVYATTPRIVSNPEAYTVTTQDKVEEFKSKGVIYHMIDEFNNDCPYDFKNILFIRDVFTNGGGLAPTTGQETEPKHCYTFGYEREDGSIFDTTVITVNIYENIIKAYFKNMRQYLNNIVFLSTYKVVQDEYSIRYNSNSFEDNCYNNSFGEGCTYNSFGNNCHSNSFGNECEYNSFGNECHSNSFKYYCTYNSFGNNCHSNSFGQQCHANSFGRGCRYNSFGNVCWYNSFGNGCDYNSFGTDCDHNSFGSSCHSNSFGVGCSSNSFGDDCSNNSFGNDCNNNSFRISADPKSDLKSYFKYNHFDDGCSYNILWNDDTTSSNFVLQHINVNRGVVGASNSYNIIHIDTLNADYEIEIIKTSDGIYTYTITETDDNEVDSVWNKIINE